MRGATADNAPRGDGLCECGCGQPAPIAKRTMSSRGRFKGEPVRFIRGHNNRGMDRSGARTTHYVETDKGFDTACWIWQLGKTIPNKMGGKGGYGKVRVKGRDLLAHRYYFEKHRGPIPEGMQIDHLCRNRDCVNPAHMEVVTPLQNTRRSLATKLTVGQAREIERLAGTGLSSRKIAPLFGISRQTVDLIRKNGADAPRRGTPTDG